MSEGYTPLFRQLLTYGVAAVYAADLKSSLKMHTQSIAEAYLGRYTGEYANTVQIGLILTLIFVVAPWLGSTSGSSSGGGGGKKQTDKPA